MLLGMFLVPVATAVATAVAQVVSSLDAEVYLEACSLEAPKEVPTKSTMVCASPGNAAITVDAVQLVACFLLPKVVATIHGREMFENVPAQSVLALSFLQDTASMQFHKSTIGRFSIQEVAHDCWVHRVLRVWSSEYKPHVY